MDVTMLAIEEPTKEEVHLDLVRIIIRQAEVRPAYRMFPTGRGVVNALAPGEADRIVRHMAASDSAPNGTVFGGTTSERICG
jgi:hypothetical protein